MFNFNELAIVHPNEPNCYRGSFVGIRKDKYLGKMAFTLPKGFDNFEINYENVKKLFFLMYRTFEKFRENGEKYLDNKGNNKDNAQINGHQGAYIFTDDENNETILYSKIDLIDKIFKTYQELAIESLIQELGLVEEVDYSKIENYLEKGIYLKNNAIFIESMVGYRNIVRGVPSELIELFCYLYKELAHELEQEVSEQIKEIAFNFSYQYLSPGQSLFSEHSFEATIAVLKDCLNTIHKTTAYKNYQYWDIYEAIEYFLYGGLEFDKDSQQGFWGINNFSYIWEEMCNIMILKDKTKKILYCDSNLPFNAYRDNLVKENRVWIDNNEIKNIFYFELNGFKRQIRPDLIIKSIDGNNNNPLIIALEQGLLSIKKEPVKLSNILNVNILNVEICLNKNNSLSHHSNMIEISEKIFQLFHEIFSKLPRMKWVTRGSLKGYQFKPLGKYAFRITNIPQDKFDEIYQDILHRHSDNQFSNTFCIIDWKYYDFNIFQQSSFRSNDRINSSVIKQLSYEFCLSQIINNPIINQFGVPYYHPTNNDIVIDFKDLECGIQLVKVNFLKVQELYLND